MAVAAFAAGSTLAADIPSTLERPAGAAPLRYRDAIFDDVRVTRDLQYGRAPGPDGESEALLLDLYEPAGDAEAERPVLVWVHGGGYSYGDKGRGPSAEMAEKFARHGYVTVSINYRLLVKGGCDGQGQVPMECLTAAVEAIHDAQAAVRWLRANAGAHRIDPERIGIGGESAGAITAVGVGIIADQPGESGNSGYPSDVNAWVSISGGIPAGIFIDSSDAPGLLFAGTADQVVPYVWSVQTAEAFQRAGVAVYLQTLDGAGHVPWEQYQELFETQSNYLFYELLDVDRSAKLAEATADPVATPAAALPSTGSRAIEPQEALPLVLTFLAALAIAAVIAWVRKREMDGARN